MRFCACRGWASSSQLQLLHHRQCSTPTRQNSSSTHPPGSSGRQRLQSPPPLHPRLQPMGLLLLQSILQDDLQHPLCPRGVAPRRVLQDPLQQPPTRMQRPLPTHPPLQHPLHPLPASSIGYPTSCPPGSTPFRREWVPHMHPRWVPTHQWDAATVPGALVCKIAVLLVGFPGQRRALRYCPPRSPLPVLCPPTSRPWGSHPASMAVREWVVAR